MTDANPLHDLHQQAEAEFQSWGETPIVQTFGEPQAEYGAIRKTCGLLDLPQRGTIELTGKDRLSFLNNLITQNVYDKSKKASLPAGQTRYAFLLNLKGRVVADMQIIELGDRTLLDVQGRFADDLVTVLEMYRFSEDVRIITNHESLHGLALHGPKVGEVLNVQMSPGTCGALMVAGVAGIGWRDDQAGVPGYHLLVPKESVRKVWMELINRFGQGDDKLLRPIGWAAFNTARIEAGQPMLGIDFAADDVTSARPGSKADAGGGALPAETGLFDRAVSVTKGCYLGQEIVARMHARQVVARQVVGLKLADSSLPIAGGHVYDHDHNPIGVVTSSTLAPMLSSIAIALAQLKRPHFTSGSTVKVEAEGALRDAQVVALPFVKA